jgi:hypothetical protein
LQATFDGRPVDDIEQRELEIKKRTRLLEIENRRLADLESRLIPCCSIPIPPRRHPGLIQCPSQAALPGAVSMG